MEHNKAISCLDNYLLSESEIKALIRKIEYELLFNDSVVVRITRNKSKGGVAR